MLITNPNKPNQDNFLIKSNPNDNTHIFAVADGHGSHGHYVSQLSINSLEKMYDQKYRQYKNAESFYKDAFDSIQNELFEIEEFNAHTSGTTMVSFILENNMNLTCANVGDSRAILARQSKHDPTKLIGRIGKSSTSQKIISLPWRRRRRGY